MSGKVLYEERSTVYDGWTGERIGEWLGFRIIESTPEQWRAARSRERGDKRRRGPFKRRLRWRRLPEP